MRNWGSRYWTLTINEKKGWLQYSDSRGLADFQLAVSIKRENKSMSLIFDSITWRAVGAPVKIDSFKKEQLIMVLKPESNALSTSSELIWLPESDKPMLRCAKFEKCIH